MGARGEGDTDTSRSAAPILNLTARRFLFFYFSLLFVFFLASNSPHKDCRAEVCRISAHTRRAVRSMRPGIGISGWMADAVPAPLVVEISKIVRAYPLPDREIAALSGRPSPSSRGLLRRVARSGRGRRRKVESASSRVQLRAPQNRANQLLGPFARGRHDPRLAISAETFALKAASFPAQATFCTGMRFRR